MNTESNSTYRFNATELLIYIWKKRLPIIILTTLAIVISVITSLCIDEKYKSEVVVFPTASGSLSHDLLSFNISKKSVMNLGEDEEVDRLLQVLNSDEIRNRIIVKYNLMKHYEIDTTHKYKKTLLNKEFEKNISFAPTKFMSINITVLDKDPQIAADIANDICSLIDTVMNNMKKDRAIKALNLVTQNYISLQKQLNNIQDSLIIISQKGVIDYESQAIDLGKKSTAKSIKEKSDNLAKYGGAYVSMLYYLEFQQENLSKLQLKVLEAELEANQNLPNKFIINKAYPAEKKSYPIRWLIVVVSTISTFLLSILLIIIFDVLNKQIMPKLKSTIKN